MSSTNNIPNVNNAVSKVSESKNTVVNNSFAIYIHKVLKQLHPSIGIRNNAKSSINLLLNNLIEKIANRVHLLLEFNKRRTATSREIQTAVKLVFTYELAKHAVSEGIKAITKAKNAQTTKRTALGLIFPVKRTKNILRQHLVGYRVSPTAAIYLAAVLEYITAEILEMTGKAVRDNNVASITERYLKIIISDDAELKILFKNTLLSGGVIPNIEHQLVNNYKINKDASSVPS